MLVNNGFDLSAIDILSTRDDHVFHAVEDVEKAVRVAVANVARSKHSVSKREPGLLRIVPVTAHNIGAACHELTTVSRSELPSGFVHDTHVDARTRPATGREPVLRVLVILEASEKTRFAQPVTLDELDPWQDLSRSTDQSRGYRCPAVGQAL